MKHGRELIHTTRQQWEEYLNEENFVRARGLKGGDDAAGEEPVLGVFQETAVGASLSLGVDAVAVVDEDLHS